RGGAARKARGGGRGRRAGDPTPPRSQWPATPPPAAPLDAPSTTGSASGLPDIACSTAPVLASPAPTTAARTTPGSRYPTTNSFQPRVGPHAGPIRAAADGSTKSSERSSGSGGAHVRAA